MKRCVSTFKFNFTLILFIVIRCSLSFAIVFFGFTQFSLLGHRFVPCVPFLAFISSSFFLNYFSFHFISVVCLFIHSFWAYTIGSACLRCSLNMMLFLLHFHSFFHRCAIRLIVIKKINKNKVSSAVRPKFCIESFEKSIISLQVVIAS